MKILTLHVDYVKFKPLKKALKSIGELPEAEKEVKDIKEALMVLTAVEKEDNPVEIVKKLIENVKDIAKQVNVKNIVLYPYAHLSSNLASPELASNVLNEAEKALIKAEFNVTKAPFGYYKEFEVKVKGHPLSELSREIRNDSLPLDKSKQNEKGSGKIEIKEEVYDTKQLLREINRAKLDRRKLKDNDHRILGQEMDLFSFNEVAPGMVFWHNNGLIIFNELADYWREEHRKAGYQEIKTPQIMDSKIWKVSGHWDKYKENNFLTQYEGRPFLVKPMNCPGGMLVYKSEPKSYKNLPLRVGELGLVHRTELSGVLAGLFRVIQFTQDDAHIFCTEKQLESEILGIMELIYSFYKKFKLDFDRVELSTRPEKRIGSDKDWDKAEKLLEDVLKKQKVRYKINKGDGAFYGPKIDFHVKDSIDRTWQLSTIQLDFSLPERFDLIYKDKDGNEQRPIILHRVIYGSIERFLGIYLEHTRGRLPTWLAPVQVGVLSFTDRNKEAALKVFNKLKKNIPKLRIETDFRAESVPLKVKDAELLRVPYVVVIGDKEEEKGTVAVRVRGSKEIKIMSVEDFFSLLIDEIDNRK